jgi:hypothetical protein
MENIPSVKLGELDAILELKMADTTRECFLDVLRFISAMLIG